MKYFVGSFKLEITNEVEQTQSDIAKPMWLFLEEWKGSGFQTRFTDHKGN